MTWSYSHESMMARACKFSGDGVVSFGNCGQARQEGPVRTLPEIRISATNRLRTWVAGGWRDCRLPLPSCLTSRTTCDCVLHTRPPNTLRHPLPRRKQQLLDAASSSLPAKPGTPELSAAGEYDAGAKTYKLTLRQSSKKEGALPFHIPVVVGLLLRKDGSEVSRRKGRRSFSRYWFKEEDFWGRWQPESPPTWKIEFSCWLGGVRMYPGTRTVRGYWRKYLHVWVRGRRLSRAPVLTCFSLFYS